MDFHKKLQELRKNKGLTQEELAEALFVSRTAISKWESGRGYPSIDSLKEISKYFSVSIDELLSGEKLISIAERENKTNIQRMCDFLLGIVDLLSFLLIALPLYPNTVDGYVYSVNLFAYTEITVFNKTVYWVMFVALVLVGILKIILTQLRVEKGQKIVTMSSMTLSILSVFFLALTRETYAIIMVFLLLIIKAILLLKCLKTVK